MWKFRSLAATGYQRRNQHPANQRSSFLAGLTFGFSSAHAKSNPNPPPAAALHADISTSLHWCQRLMDSPCLRSHFHPPTPSDWRPSTTSSAHCFRGNPHNTGLCATQGEHTQNPALLAQSILQEDLRSCEPDDLLCPPLPVC